MANLNLSEFTEKLFVADADHTFIWDTAALISKRVSRNSWLNSGTLTSDAPVTISQTWNGTGSTVFKALVVNATTPGTTSSSSSLLLDLQVGGVSQLSVTKAGAVNVTGAVSTPAQFIAGDAIFANGNGVRYVSTWIRSAGFDGGLLFRNNTQTQSVGVVVEADNTLALRNGTAAQTFRVYNTYTDASNYERGLVGWVGGIFEIGSQAAGTGATRHTRISSVNTIAFATNGIERWRISSAGNLTADADNSYDIGASGANRPRNIYVGSDVHASVLRAGIWVLNPSGVVHGTIRSESDGVFRLTDSAINNFNRLQFGNTSASFPAIKRVGAEFQVVIASSTAAINVAAPDADLTFIEDRYRRKGAGTPEGVVTAPIGAVYHNTTGGAGTSFYVKESGTGNTGWVGK